MTFADPETPRLVAQLRRRGVRVVIATDNMDSFSRFTVPALGLSEMFDDILNSFELKALKADCDAGGRSLFFQPYLRAQELAPAQCVLIDDAQPTPEYCGQMGLGYRLATAAAPLPQHLRALLEN
jgi:beta-phosphoglucomutase-like phosphatase (HAD superfamily)